MSARPCIFIPPRDSPCNQTWGAWTWLCHPWLGEPPAAGGDWRGAPGEGAFEWADREVIAPHHGIVPHLIMDHGAITIACDLASSCHHAVSLCTMAPSHGISSRIVSIIIRTVRSRACSAARWLGSPRYVYTSAVPLATASHRAVVLASL